METMNETIQAEVDEEIQGSSTKQIMKKKKNGYENKEKNCSVKPISVKSKSKQLISATPVKLESKRRRTKVNDLYIDIDAKISVIERADRVLSNLKNDFPYFLKCMLPSNVSHSFWMIFPTGFCKSYLPNCDSTITLVDENGDKCKTTYLFVRRGLSAGWRGFSISHKLLQGDILIFQLIDPCKFKVHIVRVYDVEVIDAAHGLMDMVTSLGTTDSDLGKKKHGKRGKRKKESAEC